MSWTLKAEQEFIGDEKRARGGEAGRESHIVKAQRWEGPGVFGKWISLELCAEGTWDVFHQLYTLV